MCVDEGFTARSFWLNTEPDFAELGFKMAARKLLVQFIRTRSKGLCLLLVVTHSELVNNVSNVSICAVNKSQLLLFFNGLIYI